MDGWADRCIHIHYVYICIHTYHMQRVYMYIFLFLPFFLALTSKKASMSTMSTHVAPRYKYHSPLKGPRVPWWTGWLQYWNRESTKRLHHHDVVPESKGILKLWWRHIKKLRSQFEGVSTEQIWDNLNIKINTGSNSL